MSTTLLRNGHVVDVGARTIRRAGVLIEGDVIEAILSPGAAVPRDARIIDVEGALVAPALIDAHIHLESTMLTPAEFARWAVAHGTGTIFADPHEIANVAGRDGIAFFLEQAENLPLDLYLGIPSCVPATDMEDAGAAIMLDDVRDLVEDSRIYGLGEMMNFPGILYGVGEAREKVDAVLEAGKLVDGHCPGLSGADLRSYISNGRNDGGVRISSDHESTGGEEAMEKAEAGMLVAIREGSASRDLEPILTHLLANGVRQFDAYAFCSDDLAPEDLQSHGHMDRILRRAVAIFRDQGGLSREEALTTAIRMCTYHPAEHYRPFFEVQGKPVPGALEPGRRANIVVLHSLEDPAVEMTFCGGRLVYERGGTVQRPPVPSGQEHLVRSMNVGGALQPEDFQVISESGSSGDASVDVRIIRARGNTLLTEELILPLAVADGRVQAAADQDIAKIAVIERHHGTGRKAVGFVQGLELQRGALATTIAHDSHNLIVAGARDEDLAAVANEVIARGGGMAVLVDRKITHLPLELGGLMSAASLDELLEKKHAVLRAAARTGTHLPNVFMTLSFLALPVIPALKITNRGLVDVTNFCFTKLIVDS